ncbi:multidrug resistance-associated protein 1-like [Haliotis rufescens]|uniref:multidrug resistance-associated protein 1-like n=1 Tax=Haliotis rufescens TaxID=6454 RepID=UPI00201EFC85|nr:multidrug resistance-associated protein 1-like [Haliotis rufescens]
MSMCAVLYRPGREFASPWGSRTRMEGFCHGQPLWDTNLTWYNSWPELTTCFQDTLLVWVPCGWLWLLSPLYVFYLTSQTDDVIKLSLLFIAKLFTSCLLMVTTLVNMIQVFSHHHDNQSPSYFTADVISPIILFFTLALSCGLSMLERKKGFITSGVLFFLWLFLVLAGIIPFYHIIIQKTCSTDVLKCAMFYCYYLLIIVQLVLHSFAEKRSKTYIATSPEVDASFLSRVLYEWTARLVINGYKTPIKEKDVYNIHPDAVCARLMEPFLPNWHQVNENFKATKRKSDKQKEAFQKGKSSIHFTNHHTSDESTPLLDFKRHSNNASQEEKVAPPTKKPNKYPSLLSALVKTFGIPILISHVPKLVYDLLLVFTPQILGELVSFTEDSSIPAWKGYVLAVALFVSSEVQSLIIQKVTYDSFIYGMKIRAVLISVIFRKSLTMNSQAKKDSTVGEIVNLMSVDANNINILITYLFSLWSSPLQIILALYFLYQTVGNAMFAGLAILLIMMPFNAFILGKVNSLQQSMMGSKDRRIRVISEVLNGIKVLKLYAWEESFKGKIEKIRNMEIHFLWKIALYFSAVTFSWTASPYFVALATLVTYVFITPSHYLDAKTAFVAITYFNVFRVAINLVPMVATDIVRAKVSLERISKFLSHDDLDESSISHSQHFDHAVTMENASFTWEPELDPWLQKINVNIPEGNLVAVVGQVGSGKSSLMSAMLGEMEKVQGFVNMKGSIAYVPQQAWIQNDTLQNNILFGKDMDRKLYDKVVSACALNKDLEILSGGDQTEIGEKGINLSGGQKQRVSLARAVYNDADIYLLDDPLSAVDSHVGKHIFQNLVGRDGLLKSKTRILVTHGVHWLPQVDTILVLSNGQISEIGTYEELMTHNGAFAQFLTTYLTQHNNEDSDVDEEEEEDAQAIRKGMLERLVSVQSETETSGDEMMRGHIMSRIRRQSSMLSGSESQSIDPAHQVAPRQRKKLKDKVNAVPTKTPQIDRLIQEEEVEVGKVKWKVYLNYLKALGIGNLVLGVSMYVLYEVFQVCGQILLSQWTDDVNLGNTSLLSNSTERRQYNDYYMGIYGLFGVLQALFVLGFAFLIHIRSVHASRILHHKMLTNVLRVPMSFFDTTPIGRIVNRFSQDCDVLDNQLPITMEIWTDLAARFAATVIIISYTTPIFMAPLAPLFILFMFVQRFYVTTSRQLKRLESKTRSPIYSQFSETLSGASVIRAYKAQDRFILESESKVDTNNRYLYSSIAASRWVSVRMEFLGAIIVLLASVLSVVTRDTVTGGVVGLSLSYATEILGVMTFLTRLTSEVETMIVSVERIQEYTQLKEEAPAHIEDTRPPHNWPHVGGVTFDSYSTRYRPGMDLILKDISFTVNPGEKVGIVGRTGAGKSSLTLSLFRLIEAAGGQIMIDGVSINSLGLHDLRGKLTILPQDPVIFTGSLRSNLDPFSEYSDAQLWMVLEQAHLKQFVLTLPDTIHHECGEDGENFSVGQRQLVCLARTLLRNTKILVLDEATAAVDMETDDLIQQTIRSEFKDCTVLTIAHRLNTVMDYDRILVLEQGCVVEYDSPGNLLLQPNSIFCKMAKDAGLAQ